MNTNVDEALRVLRNEDYMAQMSICIHCRKLMTRLESWNILCLDNPDPYDKGHVFHH